MPSKSSINEIGLDRLLVAVKRAIAPKHPLPLPQPPIAANDDQLAWLFVPFPEG
jgi:hypothetical protein